MESLSKKAKKEHFATLDLNSVSDNKNFGRSFNLRFLNNVKAKRTTKLVEKKNEIRGGSSTAETSKMEQF